MISTECCWNKEKHQNNPQGQALTLIQLKLVVVRHNLAQINPLNNLTKLFRIAALLLGL